MSREQADRRTVPAEKSAEERVFHIVPRIRAVFYKFLPTLLRHKILYLCFCCYEDATNGQFSQECVLRIMLSPQQLRLG